MSTPTRTLSTAEQRRIELVDAAVRVFAELGYGAPTTAIAKAAGISQAYLFRLFPTKDELFVAAVRATTDRIVAAFQEATAGADEPLSAMGQAYTALLQRDRDLLLVQMTAQVAANHSPLVRECMQEGFDALFSLSRRLAPEATVDDLRGFFAHGMLCNTLAALGADESPAPWARALAGHEACET